MIHLSVDWVERKWKDLVNTFRKKEKSGSLGMSVEDRATLWKFYDKMCFMRPYIQPRRYIIICFVL